MKINDRTIVSFDFDGTLHGNPYILNLAKAVVMDKFNDVHIVTRRYNFVHPDHGDEMTGVFALAQRIGIKRENIHFTNRVYKVEKLIELGAHIHYDDDMTEIALIRQHFPSCKAFLAIM